MQPDDFDPSCRKYLVKMGDCWTFVPPPLPPKIEWSDRLVGVLSTADRALGHLGGTGRNLQNPHLLIRPFLRLEAVLSSRIEGTQASLSQLYLFEENPQGEKKAPDVREVANYVKAMNFGLARISQLPMSRRLICELHEQLMDGVRGQNRMPGEFRRSQVWIGAEGVDAAHARFVPPPAGPELEKAMNQLESYLQHPSTLPPILRLAMVHYQFETIHPFLDGNGRIGRLLITLMLCDQGLLPQPLLYLSAWFERNRQEYYDLLLRVSQRNAWVDWFLFFARGVAHEAMDAVDRARKLIELQAQYRTEMSQKKKSTLVTKLIDALFEKPVITIKQASALLNITHPMAQKHVNSLVEAGILKEVTGMQRNRIYWAQGILETLHPFSEVQA